MDTKTSSQYVDNHELLYRAIRPDANLLTYNEDGTLRISSNAFNDALRRPSVDRASLCIGGPAECQMRFAPGSGILSLFTEDVRAISATHGVTGIVYCADVEAVPLLKMLPMLKSSVSRPLTPIKSLYESNIP